MFVEQTLESYSKALASRQSVPGGGSATALAASLGAALVSMVCHITQGDENGDRHLAPLSDVVERSEFLRRRLLQLVDQDGQVFSEVMSIYRWPKDTPERRRERRAALQVAYRQAAEVPLQVVEYCSEIVSLCVPAAELGNKWVVSDAGVAVLLAASCMQAALMSVYINLKSINDAEYVRETLERIAAAKAGLEETRDRVLALAQERMGVTELAGRVVDVNVERAEKE